MERPLSQFDTSLAISKVGLVVGVVSLNSYVAVIVHHSELLELFVSETAVKEDGRVVGAQFESFCVPLDGLVREITL